ncbi:MAG TPA: twin-arginine translocase subunit TatC [Clostridiales bacterium UBA8153]|nr:twin-arginine translocase subunit TatC [Clostridiales bacterium UBA8153]
MNHPDGGSQQLTVWEHLAELRQRLIWAALSVVAGMAGCYAFIGTLRELILRPVRQVPMVYLAPAEALVTDVKLMLLGGVAVSVPLVFYQAWAFVAPGLTRREKPLILAAAAGGLLFFLAGAAFAYGIVLPVTIRFFVGFASPGLQPMFSYGRYISFAVSMLWSFGLVFQLPLVVTVLAALGVVTPGQLRNFRGYAIVLVFVVAALLTPPDVISQLVMAVPLLLLYEVSIGLAWLVCRKKKPSGTAQ